MIKISVIGAGFAGLTVALRLAQKGFSVDVYEKGDRVGGLLGTDQTPFGISERAANALIRTEKSEALFHELGLQQSLPLKSSSKRFLFRGKPTTFPLTVSELFAVAKKVLPVLIKKDFSKLTPEPGQTLKTWGETRLTPPLTRYILGPAMQGVYANRIDDLSASLILGPLFNRPKSSKKYKGLLTGPGGMQDLVDKLEAQCRKLGVNFHLNSEVDPASLSDQVVIISTSAKAAHLLTEKVAPEVSNLLGRISMSSLMSTTVFFKEPQTKYKGFGCLIPRDIGIRTLGILMNSYIFKDRDKTYNETWIMGGHHDSDLLQNTDAQVLNLIQTERQKILGLTSEIIDHKINRWNEALPYYNLELEQTLQELQKVSLPQGLFLHGNYLSGIGLSKILERSDLIAEQIESRYAKK